VATKNPIVLDKLRLLTAGRVFKVDSPLSLIELRVIMKSVVPSGGTTVGKKIGISVERPGGRFSIIVFKYSRQTNFFASDGLADVVHGYCIVYERNDHIMVSTEKMNWSERIGKGVLQKLSRGEMIGYAAHDVGAHDSISLRPLDVGRNTYRSQRTEGPDLASTLPTIGASRHLITSLGVRKNKRPAARLALSTSSMRTPGGRVGHEDWCKWAASVLDDVTESKKCSFTDTFLKLFAQPLDLKDLPTSVQPIAVFLWIESLSSSIDLSALEFLWTEKTEHGGVSENIIDPKAVSAVVNALREPVSVAGGIVSRGILTGGKLRKNASSYSLAVKWFKNVRVRHIESGAERSLSEWIRQERCLHVLFSDVTYAYSENTLFRDSTIASSAVVIGEMIKGVPEIKQTMPEKRSSKGSKAFTSDSLFWLIENRVKGASDVLICDDEAGEWADYISISKGLRSITLVHAKSGKGTVAPAMFEGVVSQAIKNLGKRRPSPEEIRGRESRWADKVGNVARVRIGGTAGNAIETYADIVSRHDCTFRVVLAVTFLSKSAVDAIVSKAATQQVLDENETLLLWLLTSFMSHCRTIGVVPEVWCRI
jgi:hypothetical protein